jgi:hypothetical protein
MDGGKIVTIGLLVGLEFLTVSTRKKALGRYT